jgi:hypothetical protein
LDREEIRMKFKLHDIRESDIRASKVWKEAHELGKDESKRQMIGTLMAKGMSPAQIADLMSQPLDEVTPLTKATQ